MKIEFVTSGAAVITPDPAQSLRLYVDTLGLPLSEGGGSGYFYREEVAGSQTFRRLAAVPGCRGVLRR
jgi:catechol 2,3-dioxygenase-like lactoylglutathione lyase family enzyme